MERPSRDPAAAARDAGGGAAGGGGGGGGGGSAGSVVGRRRSRAAPLGGSDVIYRTSFHNTVYDVFASLPGWEETESDIDWDINWADTAWIRDFLDHVRLDDHQRVNHFRNHYELTRKDLLVKNLKRSRKALERADQVDEAAKYAFYPSTYVLPAEYGMLLEEFKRSPGALWIMKPIGRAQGKGIFLFNKMSQIREWKKGYKWKSDAPQAETYVAQRYIERPYLIGGKKFDLRLYVLVTSFSPLVIWIYRDGFSRFSNQRFSDALSDLDNLSMHLTNVSVQKTAKGYDKKQGCKWMLRNLKLYLISKHGLRRVNRLFSDIQAMIVRSLLSVQKVIIQDKHCFELYGYDVLFDTSLKPWLIEVNASPSMSAETDDDYNLKYNLLYDTFRVIDVEGRLTGEEERVGGFDLVWHGGAIRSERGEAFTSYLGCHVDRELPEAATSSVRRAKLRRK